MTLVLGDGLLVLFRDVKELTLRKCNHISILYITLHNNFKYFEKHQDKLCVNVEYNGTTAQYNGKIRCEYYPSTLFALCLTL